MNESSAKESIGLFQKGNEPSPIRMIVVVALCVCGAMFWAKFRGNSHWVEAEAA